MKTGERDVRWAVLGAGRIAERFAQSLSHVPGATLVAASFRSAEKVRTFADAHGLDPKRCYSDEALGSANAAHEALLASDDIDVVYVALPHGLHHRWSVAALKAGKAVLCEKPAALSAQEAEDVARVSRETGLLFMEAMKTRFVPLYPQLRALVKSGAIGEVLRVEASLQNNLGPRLSSRTDYLADPVCGGALYDTGIYCASWLEDFLPGVPQITSLDVRTDEITGVDTHVDAELLSDGVTGRLTCSIDEDGARTARLVGTRGALVIDQLHRPERATLLTPDGRRQDVEVPYEVDDFFGELSHVTELVRTGQAESPVMSLEATVRCAQIVDVAGASFLAGRTPVPEESVWRNRVVCQDGHRDPTRF